MKKCKSPAAGGRDEGSLLLLLLLLLSYPYPGSGFRQGGRAGERRATIHIRWVGKTRGKKGGVAMFFCFVVTHVESSISLKAETIMARMLNGWLEKRSREMLYELLICTRNSTSNPMNYVGVYKCQTSIFDISVHVRV